MVQPQTARDDPVSDSSQDSKDAVPESRDSEPRDIAGAPDRAVSAEPGRASETEAAATASADAAMQRLEAQVVAAEAELAQKKRAKEKPAPELEPIYMLLFLGFTIFALGGMHGHMDLVGRSLRHLGPQDVGVVGAIERNAMAIVNSYLPHFEVWWALDIGILVLTAFVLFRIKSVAQRRRAFRLICTLTVAVFAALMIATILDEDHPLRKSLGGAAGKVRMTKADR